MGLAFDPKIQSNPAKKGNFISSDFVLLLLCYTVIVGLYENAKEFLLQIVSGLAKNSFH